MAPLGLDDKTESEIVYIRLDTVAGHHTLYRSACSLEEGYGYGEWNVKHENVQSRTEVAHLEDLVNLYMSYVEKPKDFNLTTLRRIASEKNSNRTRELFLQNLTWSSETDSGYCTFLTPVPNITRHVLQLQLHINCVVFSHKQYDISASTERSFDYLVKRDILSYADFLRLNQVILALENERDGNAMNSDSVFHSSILKLDYICEQLTHGREKNKALKRKRKFHDTCMCDQVLVENNPSPPDNFTEPVHTNDLFLIEDFVQQI